MENVLFNITPTCICLMRYSTMDIRGEFLPCSDSNPLIENGKVIFNTTLISQWVIPLWILGVISYPALRAPRLPSPSACRMTSSRPR